MVVYQKPDSTKRTLIQDHFRKVEMSTFLDENRLMIQIDYRYMIFNTTGVFIGEVTFDDINLKRAEY